MTQVKRETASKKNWRGRGSSMRETEGRGNEAVALSALSSSQSIQPPAGLHSALSRPCQLFFSRPPCATQLQGIAFMYAAWKAYIDVIPFPHLLTVLSDISTLFSQSTKLGGLMVVCFSCSASIVSLTIFILGREAK